MTDVRIHVLGCGNAFNAGARLHACFWVEASDTCFLIDCGPSVLAGIKAHVVDPNRLDAVFVSHLHADHFLGLPFLVLELDTIWRRTRELVIVGPQGIRERMGIAMELFFPGTPLTILPVRYVELHPRLATIIGGVTATAYPVVHVPETNPHALRLSVAGRTIGYSGDTEWTDDLMTVADGADVFLCECSGFDRVLPGHLNARTLAAKRAVLRSKRTILVHMGEDVLERLPIEGFEAAQDGARITL